MPNLTFQVTDLGISVDFQFKFSTATGLFTLTLLQNGVTQIGIPLVGTEFANLLMRGVAMGVAIAKNSHALDGVADQTAVKGP